MSEATNQKQLDMHRRHFLIRAQILVMLHSLMPLLLKVVEDIDRDSDDSTSSSSSSNHSAEIEFMEAGLRGLQQLQQKWFPNAHQPLAKRLEYTNEVRSGLSALSELSELSGDASREDTPSPNEDHAARPTGISSRKRPLDISDHKINDSTLPNAKRTKRVSEAIDPREKTKGPRLLTQANLESYQKSLSATNSNNAVFERISAWSPLRRDCRRDLQR